MMNKIDKFFLKLLTITILFLVLAIICKSNNDIQKKIHYYLYEDSFNFNSVYTIYNKYLGGVSFYNNNQKTISVFNDTLKYSALNKYKDGIKLTVSNHYLVPNLNEGIVTKITSTKKYGNTIIIKTNNNINIWYGNICNTTVKIYDRIKKSDHIGESCQDYIYIVYEKKRKYLNYKKYFNY